MSIAPKTIGKRKRDPFAAGPSTERSVPTAPRNSTSAATSSRSHPKPPESPRSKRKRQRASDISDLLALAGSPKVVKTLAAPSLGVTRSTTPNPKSIVSRIPHITPASDSKTGPRHGPGKSNLPPETPTKPITSAVPQPIRGESPALPVKKKTPITVLGAHLRVEDDSKDFLNSKPYVRTAPLTSLPAPSTTSGLPRVSSPSSELDADALQALELSPMKQDSSEMDWHERAGRNKDGLIRNGLAEHASALFNRIAAEHAIWQVEMKNYSAVPKPPITGALGPGQKKKKPPIIQPPHAKFRILEVYDKVSFPLPVDAGGYVVARCSVVSSRTRTSGSGSGSASVAPFDFGLAGGALKLDPLRAEATKSAEHPAAATEDQGLVGFKYAAPKHHHKSRGGICTPDGLVEGAVVHVWEPWSEIEVRCSDPRKASLSNSSDPLRGRKRRVLLCSRFLAV